LGAVWGRRSISPVFLLDTRRPIIAPYEARYPKPKTTVFWWNVSSLGGNFRRILNTLSDPNLMIELVV